MNINEIIKFTLLILTLNCLEIDCVPDYEIEDYMKIIFFNEILQQVEYPLKYKQWQQRGEQLQSNKAFYKEFNEDMLRFQQVCSAGELLSAQENFGALVKWQHKQAVGLFHFLFQPLDWETFVQNACWARQHTNPQMFVYVFVMATLQRQLDHAMFLPKIYEIVPRYFFIEDFVKSVEDFETGDMLILQYLGDIRKANLELDNNFKVWQWWKQIEPLGQSWHTMNNTSDEWASIAAGSWWRPVDFTRDVEIKNEHARLSYFTEDVDWNAYWHSLNLLYPSFLSAAELSWQAPSSTTTTTSGHRRGEFWLYCLQQLLLRYELERWTLGFEQLESFDWQEIVQVGYNPALRAANGALFEQRENAVELRSSMELSQMFQESRYTLDRIEESIESGCWFNGTHLNNVTAAMLGNLMQANSDAFSELYKSEWYRLTHMYLAQTIDREEGHRERPHVLLNFETMLRDPLFYAFHKRLVDDYEKFRRQQLPAYDAAVLQSPGLHILSARISPLVTYFQLHDIYVGNLRKSANPQTHWTQTLYARQLSLTHKPFDLNVIIASERQVTAMLRIFLVTHNSVEYEKKYFELNKILVHLQPGENNKTFSYEHFFSDTLRRKRENLYVDAMNGEKREELWRQYDGERYCGLNTRLLLPRGLDVGLPLRLFLTLNELSDENENRHIWWRLCMPLKGERAFGFPFDRNVDESELKGTNMYWKDVRIYHRD